MRQSIGFAQRGVFLLLLSVAWWQASQARATMWNVTQFGVNPNGSADDAIAINNIIAAARPGDTVYFPAGVYDISNVINAKAGVALLGAGENSTVIESVALSGASNVMLNLGSQSNVQVSNLALNGNNDQYLYAGISASAPANSPVSGEYIHNIAIANLTATNFPNGINFWGVTGSTIANNQIFNEAGNGVSVQGCSGVLTAGNSITSCTRGILDAGGSNETILNNTIYQNTAAAGNVEGAYIRGSNLLIQGNVMNHWLSCDTFLANSAVRNNVIGSTDGSNSFAAIEMAGAANDDVFSGNILTGGQWAGITQTNNFLRQRLYYANNVIRGENTGSYDGSGNATGISQQVYLYANTFAGNGGPGLEFNGDCQNFVLDSNVIAGNGTWGVLVYNGTPSTMDKFCFVNNTIAGNPVGPIGGSQLTNEYFDSSNIVAGNGAAGAIPTTTGTFYNNMPTVSIVGSSTATVGSLVNFSSLFNDPGGYSAANYLWDLGDGLPVTTSTASFTYSQTGTYDVGLVVWDTLGRAAHEQLVLTVTAAGASSQSVDGGELGTSADPASVPEPSPAILTVVAGLTAAVCVLRRRGLSRPGG